VRSKVAELEDEAQHRILLWEAEADRLIATQPGEAGEVAAMELLTARSNSFAEEVLTRWWDFSEELIAKFGRHAVTHNDTMGGQHGQFLPAWWLSSPEVGYTTWRATGPFHGILINAASIATTASAFAASPSSTLVASFAAVVVAVATTSYQLGRWRGRHDLDRGDRAYYSMPA